MTKSFCAWALPLLLALGSPWAAAEAPVFAITQIGAAYFEPPPGRDKKLVPFGGEMEKVETSFVVAFKNRIVADIPLFSSESKVVATALIKGKPSVSLGTASSSRGFAKISADGRKVTLVVSINRLLDQAISGVGFSGTTKIFVATGESMKAVTMSPKSGEKLEFGLGKIVLGETDANSITFTGGYQLLSLSGVKFVRPDGSKVNAERGAVSVVGATQGSKVEMQWRFQAAVGAGRYEISVYDNLAEIDVPIDLVVAKPF